jgi:hypothetical protein
MKKKRAFSELLTEYTNRDTGHERKIGRYWASDINSIRRGWLTPENFFDKKKIDLLGCQRIETGNAYEAHLVKILTELKIEFEHEPKKVLDLGGIELVVKPDFVFPDKVLETKHPSSPPAKIPDWYKDQLCCEYEAFKLPVYLGIFTTPFNLKMHLYKPSEERWQEIQEILKDFHNKLQALNKQK